MAKLEPQELSFTESAPFKGGSSIECPTPASAVFNVLRDQLKDPFEVGSVT